MPTAFTAAVVDGELDDFKSFAWHCARAFMYNTRDVNEGDGRYRRPEVSISDGSFERSLKHATVGLEDAKSEHQANLNRTDDEWKAEAKEAFEQASSYYDERRERFTTENNRIQVMLAKVVAWQPPTEQHERMKEFMVEQLEKSVPYEPTAPNPQEYEWPSYKMTMLEHSARVVSIREETYQRSLSNKDESMSWLDALDDSITEFSKKVD